MNTAILIIDLQQDFFLDGPLLERKDKLIKNTNNLIEFGRSKNMPIIWIWQEYKEDLSNAPLSNRRNNRKITIEGTDGAKLLPELDFRESDYTVIKNRFSAFFQTNLYNLLQELRIERIIVGGINTMTCVRQSVIDAYQYDYNVILALDCVDAYDKEQHENSLKYLSYSAAKIKSNEEIFQDL